MPISNYFLPRALGAIIDISLIFARVSISHFAIGAALTRLHERARLVTEYALFHLLQHDMGAFISHTTFSGFTFIGLRPIRLLLSLSARPYFNTDYRYHFISTAKYIVPPTSLFHSEIASSGAQASPSHSFFISISCQLISCISSD